jgi:7-keto-8-aminopelargonate synthetase-like enzyme
MGGLTDVVGLHAAVAEYGGYLYIDDAHGISIAGEHGAGYAATEFDCAIPPEVVLAGSLSKAFGGAGGFVVLPDEADVTVIRKAANPLVFGHSIMLPTLAADCASVELHLNGEVAHLQEELWTNVAAFDEATEQRLLNAGLASPVRGAMFDTEEETMVVARSLRRAGVLVLPAFYPTVAQGTGLIRFALSSLHTSEQLRHAATALLEAAS